jgi:membrane protease YdiL (CAAX protease family)
MALQNLDNPFTKLKFRYLLLRFILLTLLITFLFAILKANGNLKLNQQDLVLLIYVIQFVSLCLWSLKDFRRLRVKLKHIVGDFPKNQNWLVLAGLVPLTILFSISTFLVLFYLILLVAPSFVEQVLRSVVNSPSVETSNSFGSNLLIIFAFCIVAPIAEEFLFRGVILQRWATKWGMGAGLLSSSLLFGFLHPNNPLGLSILGLILGVFYIKTRSLIVPVAYHALNNILAVLPQLFASDSSTTTTPAELEQFLRSYWWIGIVMMAISLPFILRFLWKNWPRKDTIIPYLSNVNKKQS